jgi:hypothetical protein
MKKSFTLSFFWAVVVFVSSCKKDDSTPAPTTNKPVTNQPSTSAPSLNAGASTSLTVYGGNDDILRLYQFVTDPQGDDWTVTSATSSNTSVATLAIRSEGGNYAIAYTGVSVGTATFTIVVTDVNGHANTLTYTITVTQSPSAPTLNAGVNTSLYVQEGSNVFWDLSDKVTDPQDDSWSVTSVVSSNTSVLTVGIDDIHIVEYAGVSTGTATMTVTLSDEDGNTSTFTATVGVAPKIVVGPGPIGPK